jgi:predicted DNA-binding protein
MTKQKNDDAILVRLPKELREQAQRKAEQEDRPIAWVVRKLLEQWTKEQDQQKPSPTK